MSKRILVVEDQPDMRRRGGGMDELTQRINQCPIIYFQHPEARRIAANIAKLPELLQKS